MLHFMAEPSHYIDRTLGGKYRILRVVGVGGMGMVFEAFDSAVKKHVALKVMVDLTDPRDVERFLAEAKAASTASHENVVQVLEVATNHDPPFFVMELLEGETLRGLISRSAVSGGRGGDALDVPTAVRIADGMLCGLAAAHRAGIVHRDIKPSNVFIESGSGRVKILDFGIAKLPTGGPHTTTGTILGTPGYLSKEQIQGERADARTDVHAVGLCLFEMIVRKRPFQGPNDMVLAGLIGVVPPRVDSLVKGVPAGLADIVAKSLAKKREDRFADASAMLAELRRLGPFAAVPGEIEQQHATQTSTQTQTSRLGFNASGRARLGGSLDEGSYFPDRDRDPDPDRDRDPDPDRDRDRDPDPGRDQDPGPGPGPGPSPGPGPGRSPDATETFPPRTQRMLNAPTPAAAAPTRTRTSIFVLYAAAVVILGIPLLVGALKLTKRPATNTTISAAPAASSAEVTPPPTAADDEPAIRPAEPLSTGPRSTSTAHGIPLRPATATATGTTEAASASASASAARHEPPRPARVGVDQPEAWNASALEAAKASAPQVDVCVAMDPNAFASGMQISFRWDDTKPAVGWWGKGLVPPSQQQRSCLDQIATRLAKDWTSDQRSMRAVYYNL